MMFQTALTIRVVLLMAALGSALYFEIREGKIKNLVTIPAAVLGIAVNSLDQGWEGLLMSVQGWTGTALLLILFYRLGVMGAGDIKLLGAIGALMGLPFALASLAFSVYLSGAAAAVILKRRGRFRKTLGDCLNYLNYLMIMVAVKKIPKYRIESDRQSKFIFSAAIVPGTMVCLAGTLLIPTLQATLML